MINQKLDFIIYYEHITRELESCILLKAKLETRGYKGEVVNIRSYKSLKYKSFVRPNVIFVPFCYTDELLNEFISNTSKKNIIINLQLEQIFSKKWNNIGWYNPSGKAKEVIHICWGKNSKQRLMNCGISDNKTPICGAIHLDLLKQNMRNLYLSKKDLGRKFNIPSNKKWVIYISSFAYSNPKGPSIKVLTENVIKNSNTKPNECKDYFDNMVRMQIESKNQTLSWFERFFHETNDETLIIYRPHPAELVEDDDLSKIKKRYPKRFFVVSELSVRQWILCSDVIATWFSTSIIEAYYADKFCSIIRPIDIPEDYDCTIYIGCKYIKTYSDFFNEINNEIAMSKSSINKEIIDLFYDNKLHKMSSDLICDVYEEVIKNQDKYSLLYKINYIAYLKSFIKYILFKYYMKHDLLCLKRLLRNYICWVNKKEELNIEFAEKTLSQIINSGLHRFEKSDLPVE